MRAGLLFKIHKDSRRGVLIFQSYLILSYIISVHLIVFYFFDICLRLSEFLLISVDVHKENVTTVCVYGKVIGLSVLYISMLSSIIVSRVQL